MKKKINIAVIGLGQIGSYVYNELNIKKKDIEIKTGKKIKVVGISAKNKNKKRRFKINKKIFYSNPLDILKIKNLDIIIEAIGLSDGISKKIIETALKNKIEYRFIPQSIYEEQMAYKDLVKLNESMFNNSIKLDNYNVL